MTAEDYRRKTVEIRRAMKELHDIPYGFPLLAAIIERKRKSRIEFYARINYNIMIFGKSAMNFEDIEYNFTERIY